MSTEGIAALRPERAFRHEALLYAGLDEFLVGTASFIREGLARREPTCVMVDAAKIAALRAELGDPPGLWFADMDEVGRNPARLIPLWHDFVDEHLGRGSMLRGVGEPITPRRQGAELVECQHHETLLNVAFPELLELWMLCPYDTAALDPAVIDAARLNHPFVRQGEGCQPSASFRDVPTGLGALPPGEALPEPPEGTVAVRFDADCLTALRALVAERAREAGLDADREADLVLSVNEIAANSIQYAGGSGTLRIWRDGTRLLCEVRDKGTINDPLVGRKAPGMSPESSRGLWVVNQLCDLVQVRSSPAGTVVRMHMSLAS